MTVSDENILLASSQIPGFVSLEYYVYAVLLGIQGDNSYSLPVLRAQLQTDLDSMKSEFREEAFGKIPLGGSSLTTASVRRQQVRMKFVKDNILESYTRKFNISLPDDYKVREGATLSELMYTAHNKGKFVGTAAEDIVGSIEGQIEIEGGETIDEYVERRCVETTAQMVDRVVGYTIDHRKQCIMNSPGFKFVLSDVDLVAYRANARVNAGDSEDVVENVNFAVLKRLQDEFTSVLSNVIDLDNAMAVISVLQELVWLTCNQEMNDEFLELTPDNAKLILDAAFPFCDKISYNNSYIPDRIFDYFYGDPKYTKPNPVTPETDFLPHFWLVYLKYYTIFGFDDRFLYTKTTELKPQLNLTMLAANTARVLSKTPKREYTEKEKMKLMLMRSESMVVYTIAGCGYCQDAKVLIGNSDLLKCRRVIDIREVKDVSELPSNNRLEQTFPFFVVTMPESSRNEPRITFNINTFGEFRDIMNTHIRPTKCNVD